MKDVLILARVAHMYDGVYGGVYNVLELRCHTVLGPTDTRD